LDWINKINGIFAKVDFDKIDVSQALLFLTKTSKELDPSHVGVSFTLEWPEKTFL